MPVLVPVEVLVDVPFWVLVEELFTEEEPDELLEELESDSV